MKPIPVNKLIKGGALVKKIVWLLLVFLVVDGIYDLSHTPTGTSLPEPPGPKTPITLKMGVDSVKISVQFDKPYKTIVGTDANPTPIMVDVVGQSGLSPGDLFGLDTVKQGPIKAVQVTLADTGSYTGIDPCDGTDVTDSVIKLPGGLSGVNGQIVLNYMEPQPVTGLQAGYIQIQHFDVTSTPVEIRLVYRASNSVICASSDPPLIAPISGSGLSDPEGIALDPVNHEIAVTNNNVNSLEVFDSNNFSQPRPPIAGDKTGLSGPIGVYVDVDPNSSLSHNEIFVANSANNSVTVYDRMASGNAKPKRPPLMGDATELSSPAGIAVDPNNDQIVVTNGGNNSITVYPRTNWINNGNQPPLQRILREDFTITPSNNTINLTETGVGTHNATIPTGNYASGADLAVAVRSALEAPPTSTTFSVTYDISSKKFAVGVTALGSGVSFVTLNWNDTATSAAGVLGFHPVNSGPLFPGSIDTGDFGDLTGLNAPCGVTVDPNHNNEIVVVNNGNDSVTVYDRTADGNTASTRTIIGPDTGLSNPCGVYVNGDEIGVANSGTNMITIYDRLATGDAAPKRTIRGTPTALSNPTGLYLDTQNDEIGVANRGNNTLTFYKGSFSTVQLIDLPLLRISPVQQDLFPEYFYIGTLDSTTGVGDPDSIAFDGNKLVWKVTDDRLRQNGDVSGAALIPPSNVVFELMGGGLVSTLELDCSQFTPFIIVQLSTNCTIPRNFSPTPVASGVYTIPAVMFKQTLFNKLSMPQGALSEPEFPRPVPMLHLSGGSIIGIDWQFGSEQSVPPKPPIINSQDVQIILTQPYSNVPPFQNCYKLVQGNSLFLIYDSGVLTPDVRSLPTDPDHPINNPQPSGCPIHLSDVQSITFTITDALDTRYVFNWQPT